MKRTFALVIAVITITLGLAACTAEREDCSNIWGEYSALATVPQYNLEGTLLGAEKPNPNGDAVTVKFTGVPKEDFLEYIGLLESDGFVRRESSTVWKVEGQIAMPQYVKDGIMLTLSWNITGGNFSIIVGFA